MKRCRIIILSQLFNLANVTDYKFNFHFSHLNATIFLKSTMKVGYRQAGKEEIV